MSKIIFDIETVGQFEALDKESQEYILKYAEDEEDAQQIKSNAGLWPFSSQIVAVALVNPDTDKGKVFFQAPEEKIKSFSEDGIDFESCAEAKILENFWQVVKNYNQVITFNGRGFDCPYLMLKSAAFKVKPTKNLMPPRFSAEKHIDLLDQLTFYGAFRKFTLDFYCRGFGIVSPKGNGLSGERINEYFNDKKYLEIARYCLADVQATKELYKKWSDYINIRY